MKRQASVLKAIRNHNSLNNFCIRKLPFQRLVRHISQKIAKQRSKENPFSSFAEGNVRFTKQALSLIQNSTENKLLRFFEDAYMCTLHAKRVTLFNKDLKLAKQLGKGF